MIVSVNSFNEDNETCVFSKVHHVNCFDCVTAEMIETLYHSSYLFSTWYQCFVFLLRDNKIDYLYLLPLSRYEIMLRLYCTFCCVSSWCWFCGF